MPHGSRRDPSRRDPSRRDSGPTGRRRPDPGLPPPGDVDSADGPRRTPTAMRPAPTRPAPIRRPTAARTTLRPPRRSTPTASPGRTDAGAGGRPGPGGAPGRLPTPSPRHPRPRPRPETATATATGPPLTAPTGRPRRGPTAPRPGRLPLGPAAATVGRGTRARCPRCPPHVGVDLSGVGGLADDLPLTLAGLLAEYDLPDASDGTSTSAPAAAERPRRSDPGPAAASTPPLGSSHDARVPPVRTGSVDVDGDSGARLADLLAEAMDAFRRTAPDVEDRPNGVRR